jgi:hypothetical protein
MMSVRDFVEQDAWSYLLSKGITPGWRPSSGPMANSPQTYQSDLVDEEVDRLMDNLEELADVLGKVLEVQPEIAALLALLMVELPARRGECRETFIDAYTKARDVIEKLLWEYCAKEAGI